MLGVGRKYLDGCQLYATPAALYEEHLLPITIAGICEPEVACLRMLHHIIDA